MNFRTLTSWLTQTSPNLRKCWLELPVLVISPTSKKAQKARINIARRRALKNGDGVVCFRALTILPNIKDRVIGSLASVDGLHFLVALQHFLL